MVLAVVALAMRDRMRLPLAVLGALAVATVLMKNLSYDGLVSGVEGSLDAHRDYANALLWVVVAQVVLGVFLLLMATFSNRVRWLAVFAALASGSAALCMTGWRQAYLSGKPNVEYVLWSPPLHWVALIGLGVSLVIAVISLVRRRPRVVTP
ncbi:MAG TPA: hypothetical protein VJM46_03815 [Candidatus Saccharimonadales bacterium]|nr:hypothetical protein [Candidatus Saccharimonadales bacterium]